MFPNETIVAIATPLGIGGIGIVRLSGPKALEIGSLLFNSKKTITVRYMHFGQVIDPETKRCIDEGCLVYFKGPFSFTGEDVVEFHLHSSIPILKKVMMLILNQGARPAGKGEFTRRAFINGKCDLTKAESVIDLIHAEGEKSQRVALDHLQGKLFNRIETIRKKYLSILEQIEASIDFPDEVNGIIKKEIRALFNSVHQQLTEMLEMQDYGRLISNGVRCLIVGQTNVGKSSLLNTLLGESRAIVTPIPGTTRDFLDVRLELGGVIFEFIDTAGMRETNDSIESLGIEQIDNLLDKTHVVLWVVDVTKVFDAADKNIWDKIKSKDHVYILLNKIDHPKRRIYSNALPEFIHAPILEISAKTGHGISILKERLLKDLIATHEHRDLDLICNVRQHHCLQAVANATQNLISGMEEGIEDDVLAVDLKEAIIKLGEITGKEVTEEVLDGIFSRFCVGK